MIVHNDIPNRLIKSLSILCTHSNVNESLLLRKIALIKIELMMINLSKKKINCFWMINISIEKINRKICFPLKRSVLWKVRVN